MPTSGSSRSRRAVVCDPVETRRHAHVDEQQRVPAAPGSRAAHLLDGLFALIGGVELERLVGGLGGCRAEQLRVERVQLIARARRHGRGSCGSPRESRDCRRRSRCADSAPRAAAAVRASLMRHCPASAKPTRCGTSSTYSTAMRSTKLAPLPGPSLYAVRLPSICCAALAQLCRPKPWPVFLVVNPWLKIFGRFSGAMPAPLSRTSMRTPPSTLPIDTVELPIRPHRFLERVLGVRDQVHENLHDLVPIHEHRRQLLVAPDDLDVAVAQRRFADREGGLRDLLERADLRDAVDLRIRLLRRDDLLHVLEVLGELVDVAEDRALLVGQGRRRACAE